MSRRTNADAVDLMADVAPAESQADVRVMAKAYEDMAEELRKVDWDRSREPATDDKLTSEVGAASDRLRAYERTVCGVGG